AYGLSIFTAHAAACEAGTLPLFDIQRPRQAARGARGKAVVFARGDLLVGDTRRWLPGSTYDAQGEIRDIPRQGVRIRAGRPVCTVFADGPDLAACYAALVDRAERVYADLALWQVTDRAVTDHTR